MPIKEAQFGVSKGDWSLHRKGPMDQARHQEKVKEAIKDNLADIISKEAIITSDGKKTVRVPVGGLDLPHFRFDPKKSKQIGQGDGNSKPGDVLEQEPGQGQQGKPGNQPGINVEDAEVEIDELAQWVFEDLSLPGLKPKQADTTDVVTPVFDTYRKTGVILDKRRTIMANIRRNAQTTGQAKFGGISNEDLRYKSWNDKPERKTQAVVFAMRDVSGSMGEFEKYISRSFYFWMVRFLRSKYPTVNIEFLTHHTHAQRVDENTFFNLGESGGTNVSSVYKLANQLVDEEYDPRLWNVYPFHFSDGDNWDADNPQCIEQMKQLMEKSNIVGYGEIRKAHFTPWGFFPNNSQSTLMKAFAPLESDPRFVQVMIKDKKDVYPALKKFLSSKEDVEGSVSRA